MQNEQQKKSYLQKNRFSFWLRFKKAPLAFCKRAVSKLIIGPIKYGKGNDYDNKSYWDDRFSKYGQSIIGPGDEGLTEEENEKRYVEPSRIFIELCRKEKMPITKIKVLEVGCGTGYYTRVLKDLGVKNYTGLDISDVLFSGLKEKFPEFNFIKKDITSDKLNDKFDLIIMIDVIQHIVTGKKVSAAMENIKTSLTTGGTFIVCPIHTRNKRHLFYSKSWSFQDIQKMFTGHHIKEVVAVPDISFKNNHMLLIKKEC